MGLLLITRFTLLEALRRRLFQAIVILSVVIILSFAVLLSIVVNVSLDNTQNIDPQLYLIGGGVVVTVLSIWMVYLLSSTLTIVFAANMISGEVEAGTFAVIVPKPLTRAQIVLGKWLGYALCVCIYTAFMFLGFLGVIYWKTGYWPLGAFAALGLLELAMLAMLGITTLGSSLVPTIVNGAIVLILFICAPTVSIIQFIGRLINPDSAQTLQNVSTVVSLLVPTDALWHGASYFLLPSSLEFAVLGVSSQTFNTPFTSAQPVAPALLVWAVIYCLVLPMLAVLRFQRRDL